MPTNVEVPALGESVREAVLIKWHKNDGDAVEANEPICELETDKANVDVPAPAAGVLRRAKNEGDTVAVGDTIARIDEGGAGAGNAKPGAAKTAATGATGPVEKPPMASAVAQPAAPPAQKPEDFRPSVRKMVDEKKVNPADLKGTGPRGMVTKEDATRAAGGGSADDIADDASRAGAPSLPAQMRQVVHAPGTEGDGTKRVPMTKIRKKIAERLVQAQQTAAILTTFNEIDMSAIIELRTKFKERFEKQYGVGLGFMSFFAKAVVLALKEFPRVNAEIDGDDVVYHNYVNLGIAVSTERGLAVPVLHGVDQMTFATKIGRA